MPRSTSSYRCTECDASHHKWAGRCADCGSWNTLHLSERPPAARPTAAVPLHEVPADGGGEPTPTGFAEVDLVLGGGLVPGSVTLLGGEPGIGKSTLLLQLLGGWTGPTLYVSGEESVDQIRRRATRLGVRADSLFLLSETDLTAVLDALTATRRGGRADLVVVDSIQTVADRSISGLPGGQAQVRGCAQQLVDAAKRSGCALVLVGHVTKDGAFAGPRTLEHLVDTVVQFEGDRHHVLRMLRVSKHRFGSTNELGLFEMTRTGLAAVDDASEMFLADRQSGLPGSVVVPTIEGRRPIVVEVQALTSDTVPGVPPRRTAQGLESARLSMLMAVLDRRGGVPTDRVDVFASVAGGVRLGEPGSDLGIALAVASSLADQPIRPDVAAFGELGLGGEVRSVVGTDRRIAEARRLGYSRILVPTGAASVAEGDLVGVDTISAAIAAAGIGSAALRAV